MSYYVTGDCHGNIYNIIHFLNYKTTTTDDVMILLGDAGLNYYLNDRDKRNKEILSEYPVTYLCIHGNHEARPESIASYTTKIWHGGVVFYEEEYPYILFARDGEVYDMDGSKVIAIGGAYSIDKEFRIMAGLPWFSDEQPSDAVKTYVEQQLENHNWCVDYVLTHTCPLKYQPTELFLSSYDQSKVDRSTEEWMSDIEKKLTYKKWYFAHYHANKSYNDAEMLFEGIKEMGKEGFVQKIGSPKYRMGELVMFNIQFDDKVFQCYGKIVVIDAYGTLGQPYEVSYDIQGPDYRCDNNEINKEVLYKHITESQIESVDEIKTRA